MSWEYLKKVTSITDQMELSDAVASNVQATLEQEMGMTRVARQADLRDGTFVIMKSLYNIDILCTLSDVAFVRAFVKNTWKMSEFGIYRGDLNVGIWQTRGRQTKPNGQFGDRCWRVNHQHDDHIEVSFTKIPPKRFREMLKAAGFRFCKELIWWAKPTDASRKLVDDMGLVHVADINAA